MVAGADSSPTPRRPWRGMEPDERQALRREKLIGAGFAMMGADGAASVTMRGVSRQAKLTERYFYESFASREELLVSVLEAVAMQARDVLVGALARGAEKPVDLTRYVVGAFTEFVTADPRRGRVLFVESMAAPELASRGTELMGEFTTTIALALRTSVLSGTDVGSTDVGSTGADDQDIELNAQAVFGAIAYLFQAWLDGRMAITHDRFVEHVAQVIEHLARATSAGTAGP